MKIIVSDELMTHPPNPAFTYTQNDFAISTTSNQFQISFDEYAKLSIRSAVK